MIFDTIISRSGGPKACSHYDAHWHIVSVLVDVRDEGMRWSSRLKRAEMQQAENTNQAISKQLASDSDTAL